MNDSQLSGGSLLVTGKTSVDNGLITSDGSGNWSSASCTVNGSLAANGTVFGSQSATAPVTASNGTIATANLRVSRVAPAGAITGVILAPSGAGAPGKELWVINESVGANSITFDVAGTSNVANGVSTVIAGLTAALFVWDSITALWYHCV